MPRLLIVDSDTTVAEMLVRRLRRRGFESTVVPDAQMGVELAQVDPPDLVLTELDLPGQDGWELVRQLRASPKTRRIPVVAVTVHALDSDRARALAGGFDEHEGKPVELPRLLSKLERLLDATDSARARGPHTPNPDEPEADSQRLLVIDDSRTPPAELLAELTERGYQVELARDAERAIQLLDSVAFRLAIIGSPTRMSALEALQALRQTHDRGALPVVVVTTRADPEDMIEALSAGASDYIVQPLPVDVLMARVAGLLAAADQPRRAGKDTGRVRRITDGTVIEGRYQLGDELGRGGCARVYGATQLSTGQDVAVKILTSVDLVEGTSEATRSVSQFKREMEAIGKLRHPHIVRLIDSGQFEQVEGVMGRVQLRPYLVMERLEGQSLAERLQSGPFTLSGAVELMLPVISALALAHAQRIVHRDIKPANIFLTRAPGGRSHPVLLDFGIAKQIQAAGGGDSWFGGGNESVMEGGFVGTPRYLAPEQADGSGRVGPATDQYALARVIVECLSGKSPIRQDTALIVILDMIASGEVPSPRDQLPHLPDALADVLDRALALAAADRWPSIAHFGQALLPFAPAAAQGTWQADFAAHIADTT